MVAIENGFDKMMDKNNNLENWIDVYMPLRLQHQITETIKECISRKGKYILGVVDNLMCNQFREKVFQDMGRPGLNDRCLQVLDQLKVDAKILTDENWDAVKEAERTHNKWNEPQKDLGNPLV